MTDPTQPPPQTHETDQTPLETTPLDNAIMEVEEEAVEVETAIETTTEGGDDNKTIVKTHEMDNDADKAIGIKPIDEHTTPLL